MAIERIQPGTKEWDAFYANHIMRYQFAKEVLKDENISNVLDAACGVGFGSKYLSEMFPFSSVVSIDRSIEALAIAREKFAGEKIRYMEDDCHSLTAAAGFSPFDTIISFETLEHLPQPIDFLNSCFHNLKTGGKIIVSTPNQLVSSPNNTIEWEFHEKEYTANELHAILIKAGFTNIKLYGQQFNQKGKMKNEIRAELNRLWSNPFIRLGRWMQVTFRGRRFESILKEKVDDMEIVPFLHPDQSDNLGLAGPFVLIAIAEK